MNKDKTTIQPIDFKYEDYTVLEVPNTKSEKTFMDCINNIINDKKSVVRK